MPTVTTVPYELTARWREGVFSGAHVGWSLLVTEDDGTKRELPQPVEPVDVGQGKGFPLADILDKLHADVLVAIAAKDAELVAKAATIDAKTAEYTAEQAARQAKEQEAAQLAAEVTTKEAELALLKLPEKERQNAEKRAQIAKLQAEIDAE